MWIPELQFMSQIYDLITADSLSVEVIVAQLATLGRKCKEHAYRHTPVTVYSALLFMYS